AARKHNRFADADRVGGETFSIAAIERDAEFWGDVCLDGGPRCRRERAWIVQDAPTWQRAERRIEMIKTGVSQWQREATITEMLLKEVRCGRIGTVPAAEPEQAPLRVPDAIARAF